MSLVADKNKKGTVAMPPELIRELQLVHSHEMKGHLTQAILLCNNLIVNYPEHPIILHYLGVLYLKTSQLELAISHLERAIQANTAQALSHNYLGIAYCQINEVDKGIAAYKNALKYEKKSGEIYYNLGIALIQKQDIIEGEKNLRKALELKFETAELYYNLGFLSHQRRENQEAIAHYEAALALNPNMVKTAINLGEALIENHQFEKALLIYEKLVTLHPDDLVYEKSAIVYYSLGKHQLAANHLQMIKIRNEGHYFLLANVYHQLKEYQNAINTYKEALQLFPANPTFLLSLVHHQRLFCIWDNESELLNRLQQGVTADDYLYKNSQYYILGFTLVQELNFAKKIAAYFSSKAEQIKGDSKFVLRKKMNKKLKIGYLSANVRNHANAYTITNLFPNHDNDHFDIYLYSIGKTDNSQVAKELMATAPHFVDLTTSSLLEGAEKIHQDDIDILVDFTGYHHILSSTLLALKPAKVQIGFMGHCGTRGADFIDYIFIDKTVTPLEEKTFYHEKLIYLPDSFFICSDKIVPLDISREELNLPEDKLILTCFNHPQKYEQRCFDAWMKILERVPNAVLCLWLPGQQETTKYNLLEHAKKYDMQNRLYFTSDLSKQRHLGRLKVLDLFLDSFDCTAQSTAIDAMSVGLPLITLYGHNVASRGASSILKAHGMSELITHSVDEYVDKAVYFASHPEVLHELRQKIIQNKQREPLFNSTEFVKKLESAYLVVKQQFEANKKDNIFVS